MKMNAPRPWDAYLTDADRAVLTRGRFAQRMGFGANPAIVVIDVQRYMVGERGVRDERYPSSCGEIGWAAVDRIAAILDAGRAMGVPVFLTRFALDASGNDIGVYGRKRTFLKERDDWCIDGTPGADLLPEVGPRPGDIVFVKKKPSATSIPSSWLAGPPATACAPPSSMPPPTISAPSSPPTPSSTGCRSHTPSAFSTWTGSSPT
jgi:Isochorismatase family